MPNIQTVLREEVSRLSRKVLKGESSMLKKASAQYRRDIAALKRQVLSLQRTMTILEKKILAKTVKVEAKADADGEKQVRFSAKGLTKHREKLGLSAADYAKLAGVSSLSIYNWEKGKAKPRKEQVVTLSALRKVKKREALARLKALGA
jgi:DNA-binding transcriptional regulator YiaG